MYNPTNLAFDYITDVPWERYPVFAASDMPAYIEGFKQVVDFVPEAGARIPFDSDTWDFRPYYKKVSSTSYVVYFAGLPEEIKDACKFYAIHSLRNKKKIPTVSSRVGAFKTIAINVLSSPTRPSFSLVTTEDIIDAIESRGVGHRRSHALYQSCYQVCRFMDRHFGMKLLINYNVLEERGLEHKARAKAEAEERKTPDIPAEYFDAILAAALGAMRDEGTPYEERATACMIVMLTQLGLRIGDLLGLTVDQLHRKTLPRSGRETDFIRYESHKPSKPHDKMLEFDIFSTPYCTEAFETLKKIRVQHSLSKGTDFLYVVDPASKGVRKNELPVSALRFNDIYESFLARRLPKLSTREWDGVAVRKVIIDDTAVSVSVPSTLQYRVHLCTALYNHGVPMTYIQKYMGHLSESMLGYYARPKDTFQEDTAYAEKTLKELTAYDLKPLGSSQGEDIKQRIKEFIEKGHFNAADDVAAIVEALGDKVAIRAKRGGVCIRTSLMQCSQDARTNEVLCAYGLCPNIFHFFYTADISYADFITLQQTYEANMAAGLTRAADKELAKMRDLCQRRLIPELNELDYEIERKGEDWVISKYPTLQTIISKRLEIREEISRWMEKA